MSFTIEMLEQMDNTTRLKTLRTLMKDGDPLFDAYMSKSADVVIETYYDTQRHLEDLWQDRCENAYVEASEHDKIRQALFAVDPKNPALDATPASYGVWGTQHATIAQLTRERDEAREERAHLLAIAEAAKKERVIRKIRQQDEDNYAASGRRYSITDMANAEADLDSALTNFEEATK